MALEMELDFERNCVVGRSPKTVLPSHQRRSSTEKRHSTRRSTRRDEFLLCFKENEKFVEIDFGKYRSFSCNTISSKPVGLESGIELRRGSVYQSSREVRKMKNTGVPERRKKIEVSTCSNTSSSLSIVDSLCSSDEGSPRNRFSVNSLSSDVNAESVSKHDIRPQVASDSLKASLDASDREHLSAQALERDPMKDSKLRCDKIVSRDNDGNGLSEQDTVHAFPKSLSVKDEVPRSPYILGNSAHMSRSGTKVRFSPIKKMFNPLVKSKSLRSPLGKENGDVKPVEMENVKSDEKLKKSLVNDFSSRTQNVKSDSQPVEKVSGSSMVANSPVHLHGLLKLSEDHGMPVYEFSLKFPEDVLVAKRWKGDNALNNVYTFHSVDNRKRSGASGWGLDESNKKLSMVGQMQVSCYFCSEVKSSGEFDNSLVTEFVLHDTCHAGRSISQLVPEEATSSEARKSPGNDNLRSAGGTRPSDGQSDAIMHKHHRSRTCDSGDRGSLGSCPRESMDLHRDLQVAAIAIQVPLGKKETLRNERGNKVISSKTQANMLDSSLRKNELAKNSSTETVKVVIPTGNHSLPNCENWAPSPLLERWRCGGGCDCGGWDMGCPLVVIGNPKIQFVEDQPLVEKQKPLELFIQGTKERIPALAMTVAEDGQYAVDFHAQLSALQAFSICVSMLHGTESYHSASPEDAKEFLQCSSLKTLLEEDVKFLMEAVTGEKKILKKVEEIPPSYAMNPPFSPIARV